MEFGHLNNMATTYKVGEAPWETQTTKPGTFAVGQAPWEVQTPIKKGTYVQNTIGDAFKSGIGQIKEGYNQSYNAKNPLELIEGGLKQGAGIVNTAFSPLAPVFAPVGKGINYLADKISNNKGVQKFATSKAGENVIRATEDINNANTIASVFSGGKAAPKAVTLAQEGVKSLDAAAGKLGEGLKPTFETSVQKALPTLKKDVGNIEGKIKNVRTAFTDIAKNKDSIGLVDKNGKPRTPQTFVETVDAQNTRLPQIYKDYTAKLSEVDKPKFDQNIKQNIFDQVNAIDSKLKVENSIDNRRALTKIKNELSSLRDTSPEGIQNYIQSINQKVKPLAPGGSLTAEQIQYANLGGEMRRILDDSIHKIGGEGYQEIRNVYAAHKSIQSQLLMAAKKEMNKIPGFTDKLGNLGLSIEGINFLLTHNPSALITGAAIKAGSKYLSWLKSPQRSLQNAFKKVNQSLPNPSKP